ncbi:transcriptional regulator [Sphaerisporangium krabiense]|uniref:DNA-binding transcriptional LysR family regulator n=1 Tax=Sphaerisporangium krabiense TaxID=763782 RepID=A0A7W8Z960_9ACTN|nr:LysR family transcriptional regulator [Sphaerisporangium krabiense]MBB5629600.1 DNA-binding transcriptional LysR family regulator [Sphaerisporangium krabiense]GII67259.1 transcriptional regulator [Sphaerisporangium krabiense]
MTLPSRVSDLAPFDLLLSVARLGSVGAAARAHGISQPTASARISGMERRLGIALIKRSARGSRLTDEGALVADWARAAVEAAWSLDAGITSLRGVRDDRLPVAASLTVAEYLLPRWLAALRASAPDTSVALTAGNSGDVAAAVLSGAAPIGFIESPDVPEGLRSRAVGHDTLTVIVAPGHPWARRRSGITPEELAATPLVSRERGSGTRRHLELALRSRTGRPLAEPLLELSSTTAIKAAVAERVGPAVLSSLAVAGELAGRTVVSVPVVDVDLHRTLRLVHPSGRALTGVAARLAEIAARSARHAPPANGSAPG